MYKDILAKIVAPGAGAIGREIERTIEAHLKNTRDNHALIKDILVSYHNFDWLKNGSEFWAYFKNRHENRTTIDIACLFQGLILDLKKPGQINNLMSGRIVSSRIYGDNLKSLVEKK